VVRILLLDVGTRSDQPAAHRKHSPLSVGRQSSFTAQLNRHSLATVLATRYRGFSTPDQLRLAVYPSVESRVFGVRKQRRVLVVPGTAFPDLDMYALRGLVNARGAEGGEVPPKKDYEVLPEFRLAAAATTVVVLALLAVATVTFTGCDPVLAALVAVVLFLPVTGIQPRASILRPELSGGPRGWSGPWRIRCGYPWPVLAPLMGVLVLGVVVGIKGLLGATPNDSLGWLLFIAGAAAPLTVWGYQAVGASVLRVDDEDVLRIRLGRLVRARVALADITTAEVDTVLWHRVRVRSDGDIHLHVLGSDFDIRTLTLPAPFLHGDHMKELAALLIDRSTAAR
ncbi:MAG: hypothetical protein ACTH9X_10015, partial [Corynebacterium variabile]|uniref:hypothetical protein n=1 Tax=Corynebacterium variabile TaxID=1727 RepID=UPI003F907C86